MDCLQTVSELYWYISSVSLPVNEPYQTLVSIRQSILYGYDNFTFFWGGCLVCLIVLVVKLPTGFEAFGPPVKHFVLGVRVVIWMAPPLFRYLKVLGLALLSEQYTNDESATIPFTLREKKLGLSVSSLRYVFICALFA